MLKKNSEVPTHPMHSRYGNINLICPKYKHELDGGDPSLSVQLGYGILSQRQFCEVKTESFFNKWSFFKSSYEDRDHFSIYCKLFLCTYYFIFISLLLLDIYYLMHAMMALFYIL